MKKSKNNCHSGLRSGISKLLATTILIGISTYSFADIKDCLKAGAVSNPNYDEIIEQCKPYLKNSDYPEITGVLAGAYVKKEDYKKALEYAKWLVSYDDKKGVPNSVNGRETYTNTLNMIGNIYYFGQAGKAHKTKGLEYITKAANLGNDLAQKQLGGFYSGDDSNQNTSKAYKWFKLADVNRDEETGDNSYINILKDYFSDKPYCVAMGEQLVAQAYIDGSAGLSKDTSKAKKYLKDAIALYKNNEPTKENLQYCKTGADKLNLESAKKQLDSL